MQQPHIRSLAIKAGVQLKTKKTWDHCHCMALMARKGWIASLAELPDRPVSNEGCVTCMYCTRHEIEPPHLDLQSRQTDPSYLHTITRTAIRLWACKQNETKHRVPSSIHQMLLHLYIRHKAAPAHCVSPSIQHIWL